MLQYKRDVGRAIEARKLGVITPPVIGQLPQVGGRKRIGLYQHRNTLTLEVALQLDREEVEPEKSSLTDGVLEIFGPVQMMSIIPIDGAKLKIGPVFDAPCGQSSPFPS